MRFVFFATIFKNKSTGVNNLILDLITELSKNNQILLLGDKEFDSKIKERLKTLKNVQILIDKKVNIATGGLYLNRLFKEKKYDYLVGAAGVLPIGVSKNIKKILYIHDFVYKEYPKTMSLKVKIIMKVLGDFSLKQADILWFNSNYTLNLAQKYFDLKAKILYVGAAIDKRKFCNDVNNKLEIKKIRDKYKVTNKLLLFVGTLEPRKNLEFLLELLKDLKEDYKLIIVGGRGWGKTNIKSKVEDLNRIEERVVFLDYVDDKELVNLYRAAHIYISTSLNEGFGLPQLEAMFCGCPVISPANSAMIEVVQNAGLLIEGWNKKEWIQGIQKILRNQEYYSKKSLEKIKEYDWEIIVDKFIEKIKTTT